MGSITATAAVVAILFSYAGDGYDLIHRDDINEVKKEQVALKEYVDKKDELRQIEYIRDGINLQISKLEDRQERLWKRQPLTSIEQAKLKKISRELRKLEARKEKLNDREQELR